MAQVEHLWAVSYKPQTVGLIGNKMVTTRWVNGATTFYMTNLDTGEFKEYNTLSDIIAKPTCNFGGKLYFWGRGAGFAQGLRSIDYEGVVGPTSGANDSPSSSRFGQNVIPVGDFIVGHNFKFNPTTNVYSSNFSISGAPGHLSGKTYLANGTTVKQVDLDTGSQIGSDITVGFQVYGATGITHNGCILWPTLYGLSGVKIIDNSPVNVIFSPPGYTLDIYWDNCQFTIGPDGYAYKLINNSSIIVADLDTGQWKTFALSPSRADRYRIIHYDGRMFIPGGSPETWA